MLDNRNAIAIILHADLEGTIGSGSNLDIDAFHRQLILLCMTTDKRITRIHHNLVIKLIKARIESHLTMYHLL